MTPCEPQQYACLPLPGLHQHLASSGIAYPKWPPGPGGMVGGGLSWEWEQEFARDPALGELRHHLLRHNITFVVFDMDLTVTASHTRGHLARDPDTVASYLASARVTDALKVSQHGRHCVSGTQSMASVRVGSADVTECTLSVRMVHRRHNEAVSAGT